MNFWRGVRRTGSLGFPWLVGFAMGFVDLLSCFDFTGDDAGGDSEGGVGDEAFTRCFFAFLLRNFSSSSDVVTSDLLEKSTLMASEFRLEREPKDGTHLRGEPGG